MLRTILVVACATLPLAAQSLRDPLVGTVVDPDGKPIAGAMVEVWRAGGRGTGLLDLDYKDAFRRLAKTPTDRRGHFAAQLLVGLPCRIIVDRPPFAYYLRGDCLPGANLTVRLQRPATLTGRILLHDGTPAKAKLRVWHRDTYDEVWRGETDDDGRYHFDRIAPGKLRVSVWPERGPAPAWYSVELEAGDEHVYDVQLKQGKALTGRVVDATTGKPIVGAKIAEGWAMRRKVESGVDGKFTLYGYGSSGYREVHCRAPGYVRAVAKPSKADPGEQLFELDRGQTTVGRVLDDNGKPLPGAYVQVFGSVHDGRDQFHSCVSAYTGDDGRFRISGLRGDLHPVVVARKDGFATIVLALPDAVRNVRKAGDVMLPRPRIVRGVLLDANGKPVANTRLSLWGHNQDLHRLAPDGPLAQQEDSHRRGWRLLDMYVGRRTSRTNERGEFAFGDIAAGTWHVVAYGENNRKIATGPPFAVATDRDPDRLTVTTER